MTGNLPSFVTGQPSVPGAGTGGAGGGGGGLGGGYSGEISEQNPNLNQLKSTNKNKIAVTPDLSGAAGQRGAVFNFGTNVNPILSSAGGSGGMLPWIIGGVAVLGIGALFLLRRKG